MAKHIPSLLSILLITFAHCLASVREGTVLCNGYACSYYKEYIPWKGQAWGNYTDDIVTTGWGTLRISAGALQDNDLVVAYAAGYLEASLTYDRISQMANNYFNNTYAQGTPNGKILDYMQKQLQYARSQVRVHLSDQYWGAVGIVLSQFDGLVAGYQNMAKLNKTIRPLSELYLYMLTSAGDLSTLNDVFGPTLLKSSQTVGQDAHPLFPWRETQWLECSSLVKLLPDISDTFIAHNTWRMFFGLLRIYKIYDFKFRARERPIVFSFSSSPGFLTSKDDWYITSEGLVIMETTNDVFNKSLYDQYISPSSLLTWQRVTVANLLAHNGEEWTSIFSVQNSGTYNNQWIVLDVKQFEAGKKSKANLLWILEQIPGHTKRQDVTEILVRQGYWPSYNIPFFESIYNISGYPAMYKQYGNQYSYSECPRAQIFKRNQTQVTDYASMKRLMRYNDYLNDPLSLGSASNAIASRYDLRTANPAAFGALDAKLTSTGRAKQMACDAISGPSSQNLPPFQWSPKWEGIIHEGLPDVWNFDWQTFQA